jgi:phage baseplate assembly protein V
MSEQSKVDGTASTFFGVYTAIVTEVNDPEREGRVRLKFDWFDSEMVTEWSRVSQIFAGNGYGSFFSPQVGDEVLVGFDQGDMRFPIVIGGLYNGEDKPPTHRADDKDEKVIRTKGGHQITLADSNGKERITIVDSKEKNRVEIDTAKDSIKIESSTGKLVLKAREIEISADTTIKITATGEMSVKGATINLN